MPHKLHVNLIPYDWFIEYISKICSKFLQNITNFSIKFYDICEFISSNFGRFPNQPFEMSFCFKNRLWWKVCNTFICFVCLFTHTYVIDPQSGVYGCVCACEYDSWLVANILVIQKKCAITDREMKKEKYWCGVDILLNQQKLMKIY